MKLPNSDARAAPRSGSVKILVVEDETLIRHDIAEALRVLGVSVVEAATADEAWHYLTAIGPVDLVFTDHRMPGSMNGSQLACKIRDIYPDLKVIITSGHFVAEASFMRVLPKPYLPGETAAALAELARKSKESERGA